MNNPIEIYQTENEVRFEQKLFRRNKSVISLHINNMLDGSKITETIYKKCKA